VSRATLRACPASAGRPVGWRLGTDYLQAIFLGVLQGLTEFLPISSSAHLRIFPEFFGWEDPGAAFTAVIQIGTELAVLIFFRKDIWRIASMWLKSLVKPEYRGHLDARMGWYIIIGTLPIVILGILLKDVIENEFRSLYLIATMLIVMGIVLGIADHIGSRERTLKQMNIRHAGLLGAAQALALVPGVSRSGATISAGLLRDLDRVTATRLSFLLGIPALVGAGAYELKDATKGDASTTAVALATVVAFVVAYASIAFLLRFVSSHKISAFAPYRIALGTVVIVAVVVARLT
jgi:undecaprenyl-diphosphatase